MVSVFFFKNHAVCEIMVKNIIEPERTQTIWHLRVAYRISKPTCATHKEMCNTYCFSTVTMVS